MSLFDEPEDDFLDDGESLEDIEAPIYISLHHHIPMTFGGQVDDGLLVLTLPTINAARLRQPEAPSLLPPEFMPTLFDPNSLKLLPPPGVTIYAPLRPSAAPAPRLFPVADAPSFVRPVLPAIDEPEEEDTPIAQPIAPPASAPQIVSAPPAIRPSWGERVNPLVVWAFYMAAGAGIAWSGIDPAIRYTVLWAGLIALGVALVMVDSSRPNSAMSSSNILWGFGIGFIVGLPLLIAARPALVDTVEVIFPLVTQIPTAPSVVLLFQSFVLVGPLGETVFYRGAMQDQRGFLWSAIASAGNYALFFLPLFFREGGGFEPYALFAIFILSLLGAVVYSYVRSRYGMTAALICQMTVNFMLLFIPGWTAAGIANRIP